MPVNGRTVLLIDADDTLWHNNIFFNQAIERFVDLMVSCGFCRIETEKVVRKREMENVRHHGYGSISFTVTLREVYGEFCERHTRNPETSISEEIEKIGRSTREYPIELLPGVAETLPALSGNFDLLVVTKGNTEEQINKINRSNLGGYFLERIVVEEKDETVYREIIKQFDLVPENTWMIGNSPRSDINPAKSAGLKTVLIPYGATWEHELEQISETGHETVILKEFGELTTLFETG